MKQWAKCTFEKNLYGYSFEKRGKRMSDSICKHSQIAVGCSQCAAEREARRKEEEEREQQENEN